MKKSDVFAIVSSLGLLILCIGGFTYYDAESEIEWYESGIGTIDTIIDPAEQEEYEQAQDNLIIGVILTIIGLILFFAGLFKYIIHAGREKRIELENIYQTHHQSGYEKGLSEANIKTSDNTQMNNIAIASNNEKINNCPFCGKKISISRPIKYCPYCNEPLT